MKMLIVASPTLSPLSAQEPIPTDGQPEHRHLERKTDCRDLHGDVRTRIPHDHTAAWVSDGPYPFTVAVWQECATCEGYGFLDTGGDPGYDTVDCPTCHGACGAVVATVEVTGRGHHADECATSWPQFTRQMGPCHPDALPDHWHTPTSTVTRLAVPIPTERPSQPTHAEQELRNGPELSGMWDVSDLAGGETDHEPAPWWWADLDIRPREEWT